MITHEIGNAMKRLWYVCTLVNTVKIQMMRNRQTPVMVSTDGSVEWPSPRIAPAGISYKQQSGSNASMHMILVHAMVMTSVSVENHDAQYTRKITSGPMMAALEMSENKMQSEKMFRHRFISPAA